MRFKSLAIGNIILGGTLVGLSIAYPFIAPYAAGAGVAMVVGDIGWIRRENNRRTREEAQDVGSERVRDLNERKGHTNSLDTAPNPQRDVQNIDDIKISTAYNDGPVLFFHRKSVELTFKHTPPQETSHLESGQPEKDHPTPSNRIW